MRRKTKNKNNTLIYIVINLNNGKIKNEQILGQLKRKKKTKRKNGKNLK